MSRETYSNFAENQLVQLLKKDGWDVSKRGWPDFLCVRGNEIACVEVKKNANQRLKKSQIKTMNILKSYGIPCYRYDPDKGLQDL